MRYLLLLITSCLLISCSDNQTKKKPVEETWKLPTEAAELYKVVGVKHDDAMLLMSDIEGARSKLRVEMKMANVDSLRKDSILTLLTALKKADDGMMNWMHEFKSTELNEDEYKKMSEAEILTYLKEEEAKIEQIHLDMSASVDNGNAFLEK